MKMNLYFVFYDSEVVAPSLFDRDQNSGQAWKACNPCSLIFNIHVHSEEHS